MDKNINKKPKVSIILPTCNRPDLLFQAIQSILNQSFQDFEIIIIDDGLEKRADKIIKKINDDRITYIQHLENKGASASRNTGVKNAKGEFIALLDDDDVWFPQKLKIQVKFLDNNPQIGVIGSWIKFLGMNKKKRVFSNPNKIKVNLLFASTMIHSTIMIRKKILDKYNLKYDYTLLVSEDYNLWVQISNYTKLANIKKVLVKYRIHKNSLTKTKLEIQRQTSIQIRKKQLKENLQIDASNKDMIIHQSIYKPKEYELNDFLNEKEKWFNKLIEQNQKTSFYKEPEFSQVLSQRWLRICSLNSNYNRKIWKRFWKSNFRKKLDLKEFENWKIMSRFFLKCLLK